MASSFRMMLFPPSEAMTTAEPPEAIQIFNNPGCHVYPKSLES